jgi:hypothetical protein
MKLNPLLTALALIATFAPTFAHATPPLSIDKALKIANEYLKENGRTDTAIAGISLEKTSMTGGNTIWAVRWETPVLLSDTKRETGLEIAMDGSFARYTEKTANKNTPASVGVPAERAALSNHRTRTDRPSILDLKH